MLHASTAAWADSGSNSGSGSGNSGSGGDNSGSDGGSDDSDSGDDDDGNDTDDDDADDNSSSNSGSGKKGGKDQYLARKAVAKGNAVSLIKLKAHLAKNYPGKILKLNLEKRFGGYIYRVRLLQAGNRVKNLTLNARTLQRSLF